MAKWSEENWRWKLLTSRFVVVLAMVQLLACTVPGQQSTLPGPSGQPLNRMAVDAVDRDARALDRDAVDGNADVRQRGTLQQALALMKSERFADAAALLESVAAGSPPRVSVLLNLAIAQAQLGDDDRAEQALRQVIELDGGNAIAYNQLGMLLRRGGQFLPARQAYQQALTMNPEYPLAHLNLGILCDLYLRSSGCALHHYRQYQRLSAAPDAKVQLWIEDLQQQIQVQPQTQVRRQIQDQQQNQRQADPQGEAQPPVKAPQTGVAL